MILKQLKVNSGVICEPTNCYIVQDEKTKETMVIDPGGDVNEISNMLDTLNAKVKYIVITHCHGDHIAGVKELIEQIDGNEIITRGERLEEIIND